MFVLCIPLPIGWGAGLDSYWDFLDCSRFKQAVFVSAVCGMIYVARHAHSGLLCVRSVLFLRHITCLGCSCVRTCVSRKTSCSRRAQLLLLLVKMAPKREFFFCTKQAIKPRAYFGCT